MKASLQFSVYILDVVVYTFFLGADDCGGQVLNKRDKKKKKGWLQLYISPVLRRLPLGNGFRGKNRSDENVATLTSDESILK
jgi:hypothetical protein